MEQVLLDNFWYVALRLRDAIPHPFWIDYAGDAILAEIEATRFLDSHSGKARLAGGRLHLFQHSQAVASGAAGPRGIGRTLMAADEDMPFVARRPAAFRVGYRGTISSQRWCSRRSSVSSGWNVSAMCGGCTAPTIFPLCHAIGVQLSLVKQKHLL